MNPGAGTGEQPRGCCAQWGKEPGQQPVSPTFGVLQTVYGVLWQTPLSAWI